MGRLQRREAAVEDKRRLQRIVDRSCSELEEESADVKGSEWLCYDWAACELGCDGGQSEIEDVRSLQS